MLYDNGVGKFTILSQQVAVSQKRYKIGPKVLLMTYRKSHTPFQNQQSLMTLDDRYELYCRKKNVDHKSLNEAKKYANDYLLAIKAGA